jgi:molybdopterin-biosynthesis enzyme MoeA-like protein
MTTSVFDDVDQAIVDVHATPGPGASAHVLLDWVIHGLQQALNSPTQHEQLQKAVNVLKQAKSDLAAAVEAAPGEPTVVTAKADAKTKAEAEAKQRADAKAAAESDLAQRRKAQQATGAQQSQQQGALGK